MNKRIKQIIADQLGKSIDDIRGNMLIKDDLGADSLDMVEFLIAIEDEFGVKISDDEAENLKTVDEAIKYIEDHVEE